MLIAFPIIGWAMNRWLHAFAYRVDMGIEVFVFATISVALLTLLTVGYQALKAALMDPIKSLKSE